MLFQAFNQDHRPVAVNGLPCTDRLQAMQRIFEHELIHLVELIAWGNSSCRGERFHALAQRIFGHTERTHRLITRREIACNHYGLHVGDRVRFNFEGQELTGILNRITKRATVLVEREGGMRYSDGKHYAKFYVPISLLRRLG
jgi:hypothetical protein